MPRRIIVNEDALLAAFVQGMTGEQAAKAAGCHARTASRWYATHYADIQAARAATSAGILNRISTMIPQTLDRLDEMINKDELYGQRVPLKIRIMAIETLYKGLEIFRGHDWEERFQRVEKMCEEVIRLSGGELPPPMLPPALTLGHDRNASRKASQATVTCPPGPPPPPPVSGGPPPPPPPPGTP